MERHIQEFDESQGCAGKAYNKDEVEREFHGGDLVFLYDETTSASQNPKLVNKWKEINIHINRLKLVKELPEDYSRGYLRRTDDTPDTERETRSSKPTSKCSKRQTDQSADLYDDSGPPMEESPKSTSTEPSKKESFTETTGSDYVFRDNEDDWSSVNDTFSSDEDDDDDDDDSNPPGEVSRHSGTYPKTSTPKESDDEQKSEPKKPEHFSTSSTEDHSIQKKDRRESTNYHVRMPKLGHKSTSSTMEGRTFKRDRTDDATQEVTPEEEEEEEEGSSSPPERCQGPSKRG